MVWIIPFSVTAVVTLTFIISLFFFKPWTVKGLFFRTFVKFSLQEPEILTTLGLLERLGYHRHNAKLNNGSQEHEEKVHQFVCRELQVLKRYDQSKMTPEDRVSASVMTYFLKDLIDTYAFKHHDYPVNQMFGVQSSLPNLMMSLHPLMYKEDVKNYAKRLRAFDHRINQEITGLKLRQEKGVLPPRFTIDKVLAEMRAFIAAPPEENPLYSTFIKRANDQKTISQDLVNQEKANVLEAIKTAVYPAYTRLIRLLETFQEKTSTNHGVWALPDGDTYYAHCLKSNTTTDYSPEAIHNIGLDEVKRIEEDMRAIFITEGYEVNTTSPAKLLAQLALEPQFQYPNTDEGRDQCLEDYRAYIQAIEEKMQEYFYHKPKMALKIDRIPEFKEKTAPGAYYMPGDLGGNRPGVFSVNLRDMSEIRKFEMKTLAYHEGVPGHHFQIALASEKKNTPMFRRILPFTAYAEGWAMYSEQLAREMGMYDGDPFGLLGSLDSELFRAVRLVVDTGIHYKKWTREEAITYMSEHSASAYESVVSEIERYFVMPGQACAYKIGMIKMLELREKYKNALGDLYTIKDFHDIVLSAGSVPLEVLEGIIDTAIESYK